MRITNDTVNSGLLIQKAIDAAGVNFTDRLQALENDLIGTIQTFCYKQLTEKYLPCDGRELSISEYPALFDKIGTTFGGDGIDTFGIPDLRGIFVRGASEPSSLGTRQDDMMRKLTGRVGELIVYSPGFSSAGVFAHTKTNRTTNTLPHGQYNEFEGETAYFDSSIGVEGQEGTYSPNVGPENRPKNMSLIFGIRVK